MIADKTCDYFRTSREILWRLFLSASTIAAYRLIRKTLVAGLLLHVAQSQGLTASAITSDGTMGTTITQGGATYDITGGNRAGSNLFHSFGLFSVGTGDTANFLNDSGLATSNIIGRVTGGQTSSIFGTIKTTNFGNASLFLINPAGWVFGPTASLNVGGSFHVSTADYLKFADGAKFHADLAKQSALTTAAVSAFGFLSQNPAGITIQESTLQVPEGQTLSLIGGDINIVGNPFLTFSEIATLSAPAGKINIASVTSPGEVPLNVQDMNLEGFPRLGEINVSNFALLDASGNGGGTLVIRGGKLLVDSSFMFADNRGNIDGAGLGMDIDIASGAVIQNGSFITTDGIGAGHARDLQIAADTLWVDNSVIGSRPFGSGDGGNVTLNIGNLTLTSGASLSSNTSDAGKGGTVRVMAGDSVSLDGSEISADALGAGNAGDIVIEAKNVALTGGARIGSDTLGSGKGGTVRVMAGNTVSLDGAQISASTGNVGGDSGDIVIEAKNVVLTGGGKISSDTFGSGKGGTVRVTASETVSLDGSQISASTDDLNIGGDGGDIVVEAKNVALTGGGKISSDTFGSGRAGTVRVTVSDAVRLDGDFNTGIFSDASSTGDAGDIVIAAKSVALTGGARIASDTFGSGKGGTVGVTASDRISLTGGSEISSGSFGDGLGGSIEVRARQVNLKERASISATSFGDGNAGDILIDTQEFRSANSSVTTQSDFSDGGNIKLSVGSLVELVNSQITATVESGVGSGGNISIDHTFVILNNSQISANAFGGPGGKVTIIANVFLASADSSVTASSALSTPGTVDIQAPIVDLSGSLVPLPESVLPATALLRQSCGARFSGGKLSSLVAGSREGLPLEPGGYMPSPLLRIDGPSTASTSQRELGPDGLAHSSILLASATPLLLTSPGCTK